MVRYKHQFLLHGSTTLKLSKNLAIAYNSSITSV